MADYAPVAYTTAAAVKRILRTQNNKIRIGDDPNDHLSDSDLTEYIKDASAFIDSMLRDTVKAASLPLTSVYAEIYYAAPRLAAFLIYRDMYGTFRIEQVPAGPRGWLQDAQDMLTKFIDSINQGNYSALSPAVAGPGWVTVIKYFQNQFGVEQVHDMTQTSEFSNPSSCADENVGPWD
jgi:hypothetical protein